MSDSTFSHMMILIIIIIIIILIISLFTLSTNARGPNKGLKEIIQIELNSV